MRRATDIAKHANTDDGEDLDQGKLDGPEGGLISLVSNQPKNNVTEEVGTRCRIRRRFWSRREIAGSGGVLRVVGEEVAKVKDRASDWQRLAAQRD